VREFDSPFSEPELEEISDDSISVWVVALGAIGFTTALVSWLMFWLLA
jgi:hypothetical protein